MKFVNNSYVNDIRTLLDTLIDQKINSTEFINSEKIIEGLSSAVDRLKNRTAGHILLSISHEKQTAIILINKIESSYKQYSIDRWIKEESIPKVLDITVHEESDEDIYSYLEKNKLYGASLSEEERKTMLIKESLTGYSINKKQFEDISKFIRSTSCTVTTENIEFYDKNIMNIFNTIRETKETTLKSLGTIVKNFCDKLNCDKLNISLTTDLDYRTYYIGKIDEIKEINNKRLTRFVIFKKDIDNSVIINVVFSKHDIVISKNATTTYYDMNVHKYNNCIIGNVNNFDLNTLERIPYNFLDKGRYFVVIQKGNQWNIIVSEDPRIDSNNSETFINDISEYVTTACRERLSLLGTHIKDGSKNYHLVDYLKHETDKEKLQAGLKAIKKMVDEYYYIDKKKQSIGQDVMISDNIKFNHKIGKISYNDFSISIDDEIIKQDTFRNFEDYLLKFYRNEMTEEEIINNVLDCLFKSVKYRISMYRQNLDMNIVINNKVVVKLEQKLSTNKNKLTYLNGSRFNMNEIIVILKEMTCYREQSDADNFIKMLGKIGLSTYIGVTTGYEIKNGDSSRIYKFRKEKGRSKYTLILDTIDLPITGKKTISMLYSDFIKENPLSYLKLNQCIFESTSNSLDYLKYKFLIDASYTAFKNKSKEFLEKKMKDIGATHVEYLNKKSHKILDAILVKGTSGNEYVIAYNSKDSFVFMNPDINDGTYSDGKYICMVDQSNIKSNIGYDTVISKMLAVKNDSVISEQIYNLKDQLDIQGDDEDDKDRENDN